MKFVAPEQEPEQAEVIKNTPFWPDVDLSEFRSVMRTDGTVTQPRLKQVVLTAISEVNAELYDFRHRQQMLGWQTLADVPAEMLDGKSERIQHYHNAVFCWARAVLNERYQDYDATASGARRVSLSRFCRQIRGWLSTAHFYRTGCRWSCRTLRRQPRRRPSSYGTEL